MTYDGYELIHQSNGVSCSSLPSQMLVSFYPQPLFTHGSTSGERNMCGLWLEISTAFIPTILDEEFKGPTDVQSTRPAIIGVHTITCRDPSVRTWSCACSSFPRRDRKGHQRGACGATAPRLAHPRIMETGCQRLWSSSETVNSTLLLCRPSKLQRTQISAISTSSQQASTTRRMLRRPLDLTGVSSSPDRGPYLLD
jgi:hypothetical protein